ncbi:MAG: protein kinase [Myxococcota bacterium]
MDLSTGTVVDRYTVQSVLGEGGMAVVYLCRHNQLGTLHALKVLTMSSRAIRERLVQEGRVQAQLRHRNIVAVTDIIMLNGAPGLVMEFIEGPSLDELLEQKPLTFEQAEVLAEGILDGVAHAHAQGLVHRDLKPANIMLSLEGSMLVPKVTDFGLAKLLEGDTGRAATRTGSTMGTPHYMSPEQVSDSKNVDHRTDVFALGAILYELVCGRRAFGGENLLQIFTAVASARFTPPRDLRPELPDRMERAILGALEPDKEKRIQTVEELRAVWTGRVVHPGGAEPVAPSGPFDAAFLSSVSKSHSVDSSPSSEPTVGTWAGDSRISLSDPDPRDAGGMSDASGPGAAAISVETLHQGPELAPEPAKPARPEKEAKPASLRSVPPPPSDGVPADSLVSGTSLVVGGGAAFVLAAVVGGLGITVIGLIGFWAMFMSGDSGAVPAGPRGPDTVATRPVPVESPSPTAPSPTEPAPVPVASAPNPTVKPGPAPVRPTPAPIQPGPVPSDAVVDPVDPEPVDPEPVDPEPVEPGPEPVVSGAATGMLGDADPAKRIQGVQALSSDASATSTLLGVARNDSSRDVQEKAWQVICDRYERGVGDQAAQEAFVVENLNSGVFSKREAAITYGKVGRDYKVLVPLFNSGGTAEVSATATALGRVAVRAGTQDEVRPILEGRMDSANFVSRKFIKSAIESL